MNCFTFLSFHYCNFLFFWILNFIQLELMNCIVKKFWYFCLPNIQIEGLPESICILCTFGNHLTSSLTSKEDRRSLQLLSPVSYLNCCAASSVKILSVDSISILTSLELKLLLCPHLLSHLKRSFGKKKN